MTLSEAVELASKNKKSLMGNSSIGQINEALWEDFRSLLTTSDFDLGWGSTGGTCFRNAELIVSIPCFQECVAYTGTNRTA